LSSIIPDKIENSDFIFENSYVKIRANRKINAIKLAGLQIGPFEEGNEYEVYYWVAKELEKTGIARLSGEELDNTEIFKIQWKERVQTPRQICKLSDGFYPKLRRYLSELKIEASKKPEKVRDYEKVRQLALDIVNLRLKKIISLASTQHQTEQFLRNITNEERFIYERLYYLINTWKKQILKDGGEE
jgi:hypothetical protein